MAVADAAAGPGARPVGDGSGSAPGIDVRGLTRSYARGRIRAVREVSFTVGHGEVFGLIGPDGAGKTSVLQILGGVLSAHGGAATVGGVDAIRRPEAVKDLIGYMPQGLGLNLYDSLTVGENIEFFRDLRRVPAGEYAANRDRLLAMTRLAPFLDRRAGALSGGMRQKLALICTLVHLPDVLLLDEPTTGVDPISRRDFWSIVHGLVVERGVTVLLTTAYMDEAERCHRVALLHEGEVIASGQPQALVAGLAGRVFAIRGQRLDDALAAVRAAPAVRAAAIHGEEVRVLADDGAPALGAILAAVGLADMTVAAIPAGFEDVFVHHLTRVRPARPDAGALPADVRAPAGGERSLPAGVDASPPVDAGAPVVIARELTRRFDGFAAVDAVSLEVRGGEILGLLGPNGAGKTTLIRMLCGLDRATAGTATVAGHDVRRARADLRARIGYMAQRFSLYRDQSVLQNLRLSAWPPRCRWACGSGWRWPARSCTSPGCSFSTSPRRGSTRWRASSSGTWCTGWPTSAAWPSWSRPTTWTR
jgi:ABC-type multidrug transport system ATPase subunit